jgi:hypothetical protein
MTSHGGRVAAAHEPTQDRQTHPLNDQKLSCGPPNQPPSYGSTTSAIRFAALDPIPISHEHTSHTHTQWGGWETRPHLPGEPHGLLRWLAPTAAWRGSWEIWVVVTGLDFEGERLREEQRISPWSVHVFIYTTSQKTLHFFKHIQALEIKYVRHGLIDHLSLHFAVADMV